MNLRPILHVVRVVVASPSDVQPERNALVEVVDELNRTTAKERGLLIDLVRWETDVNPGFHIEGPQEWIDLSLKIEDCDLLIGIFWKRFGKPTKDAKSGTEHEIRKAYEAWKRNKRPQLMIYFKEKPYWPKTNEELNQQSLVMNFKSSFFEEGLYSTYTEKSQFVKLVRVHLTRFIWNTPVSDGTSNNSNTITNAPPIEEQISLWVQAVSESDQTKKRYEDNITSFRKFLQQKSLDLNSEEASIISSLLEEWAGRAVIRSSIKPRTYNNRISMMRSFYKEALKQHWITLNPIAMVELREIGTLNSVNPLDLEEVKSALKSIPRLTPDGKRDYALLCLLLTTGRHVSEVIKLRCGDIHREKNSMTITFKLNRSGEVSSVSIYPGTAKLLNEYISDVYPDNFAVDSPLWLSFSPQNKGKPIGKQTVAAACNKYLGTTQVEATRRTYEMIKEEYGIKRIENIENLLGIDVVSSEN